LDSFKRILGLVKPYLGKFLFGAILSLVLVGTSIITPYVTQYLVDDVIKGGSTQAFMGGVVAAVDDLIGYHNADRLLAGALILLFGFALLRAASIYIRNITFERISQNIVFDLRQTLYDHLHSLPFRFYDNHRIGEIMSRMTGDMDSVRMLVANGLLVIIEHSAFLFGSLAAVFALDYRLALVILAIAPFITWLSWKFNKVARPQQRRIREQIAVLNTRTQENISGVRVVKAYAREEYEKEAFAEQNRKHLDMGIEITRTNADYSSALDFFGALPAALLLLVGGFLARDGVVTPGTLVAAVGYIWMIMMPLRNLSNTINMITQAISSGDRLFYYADFGSEIKEKPGAIFPKEFKGHVRFENVTFRYEDDPVLRNISFDVPPGRTLAIMGATGAGKTSIVNLLSRFYDCGEGSVKIDGIDVKDYQLKELRRRIGYVMQETFLFSETLENNIAFGRPEATEDELDRAAAAACATEYIAQLDEGYRTIVGERGLGLSGGQKQRAAIARALCYDPVILVLDDATSAVDMETEFAIQQALKREAGRRTTFVISHRISAVKDADEIIVLDGGAIVERGRHFELLKKRGLYYNIFMDQYRDYEAVSGERLVVG
jgi:ATP-binding cassette subfamily B multidrug efflux pump